MHSGRYSSTVLVFQDKDQRSLDVDTGKAMLTLLLGKSWSLFTSFHHFLEVCTI